MDLLTMAIQKVGWSIANALRAVPLKCQLYGWYSIRDAKYHHVRNYQHEMLGAIRT